MKRMIETLFCLVVIVLFHSCMKSVRHTSSLVTHYFEMKNVIATDVDENGWHRISIGFMPDYTTMCCVWDGGEKKKIFDKLSKSYGDTNYNREVEWEYQTIGVCIQHISKVDVVSNRDFDSLHPAGTSLSDVVYFYGSTPYPCVASGYRDYFILLDSLPFPKENPVYQSAVAYNDYKDQPSDPNPFFPIYKRLSDMTENDYVMVVSCVLFFTSKPEGEQTHTLTVTLTTTEGEQFSDEVVYTF